MARITKSDEGGKRRAQTKDGRWVTLDLGTPAHDEAGNLIGYFFYIWDHSGRNAVRTFIPEGKVEDAPKGRRMRRCPLCKAGERHIACR